MKTEDPEYARRLATRTGAWWKRIVFAQLPYRLHLRRLRLGYVLDAGCGIGRNLENLGGARAGVGFDHNPLAVEIARRRGLVAYTNEEFLALAPVLAGRFDSLLLSHVAEHISESTALELLRECVPLIRPDGRVVIITPQEAGFRSDPTHVRFVDFAAARRLLESVGLRATRSYSFPFPRATGAIFRHNEFVVVGARESGAAPPPDVTGR